jgi:hypothetical protein
VTIRRNGSLLAGCDSGFDWNDGGESVFSESDTCSKAGVGYRYSAYGENYWWDGDANSYDYADWEPLNFIQ